MLAHGALPVAAPEAPAPLATGTLAARLWWMRILLLVTGLGVTIHVLRIKTRRK